MTYLIYILQVPTLNTQPHPLSIVPRLTSTSARGLRTIEDMRSLEKFLFI